ncbi:hypothetical protein Mgra_00000699 [Meloidogyne graminicola]|uniref:Ubiquitin-like domain-containing protein n=1 Tax=Meloidogyne graminicola TaxID=189291 RepID=A0A8T0A324_9BILA|nr:hypothetical protein Mgra_00000699 [Meloidogyne graminicola]
MTSNYGDCAICWHDLSYEDIHCLTCKHLYHKNCITRWLTDGTQNCPKCMKPSTVDEIEKIVIEPVNDTNDMNKSFFDSIDSIPQNLNENIQINVRDIDDKQICFQLKPTDTVLQLKNLINEIKGIPVENQRLIYYGQYLKDEYTIDFYKISNNTIVDVIINYNCN